jgi:hypothetical protein
MNQQMQISLDELISMMMSRMDGLAANQENMKSRYNILGRVLYKKGIFTEEDILDSIREEHRILKELGMIEEIPGDEELQPLADSILQWIRGDVEDIKKTIREYEEKIKAAQQERQSKIDIASSADLEMLNKMGGKGQEKSGGKFIL